MNFKFLIQYDGTDFHGWQIQNNDRTVQGELQKVLSTIEGENVHVAGSGRTDAGVHAEGQVATAKISKQISPEKLRGAMNGNLSRDVRILQVENAAEDFHARFSAKGKTYLYRVINAPVISPFWFRYALHERRPLDFLKMNQAARLFLGEHDWTAFSCVNSDSENKVRTISEFTVESLWDARSNSSIIEFRVTGNGFLRYMVRSIVGTILEAGRGEKDLETIQTAIVSGEKSLAGATAAAHGLSLVRVFY